MIVLLLLIIACVLLFGKENTKNGIVSIIATILMLALIAVLADACGII